MNKLTLTDVERLILANQYQILDKLDSEQGYGLLSEQLREGHSFFYNSKLTNWFGDAMSDEDQKFVVNVLDMFSLLNDSYNALEDKTGIDNLKIKFRGFDANDPHELNLSHFASGFVKEKKFTNIIPHGSFNSHTRMVRQYTEFLEKFNKYRGKFPLTKEEIIEIIS
jgi:uncharacterized protein YfbU (UPF0304 family)